MFKSAFKLYLSDPVHTGQASIGCYNGTSPSLTCVTNAGKVFLHTPQATNIDGDTQVKYLNINKEINCIASGTLDPVLRRDVLLIGTPNNLLAYDVEENRDLFYREVPDGVTSCLIGKLGDLSSNLALIGGNCSVQGFDAKGSEAYWTVTSDVVSAMAFANVTNSPGRELLVGSKDSEIRIFQKEQVIEEVVEVDEVTGLCPIYGSRFAYALANGTVGIYNGSKRAWRVKSRHMVNCINSFDLDGDGVEELLSGWSNGKFEVRSEKTGETLFKENFSAPISAILCADFRNNGREEVICCTADGEVKGYLQADSTMGRTLEDSKRSAESLGQLQRLKAELQQEVRMYQKANFQSEFHTVPGQTKVDPKVNVHIEKLQGDNSLRLVISSAKTTGIKALVLEADGILSNDATFFPFPDERDVAYFPLDIKSRVPCNLSVKVLVGFPLSNFYHAINVEIPLGKFTCFIPSQRDNINYPDSYVKFKFKDTTQRFVSWIDSVFQTQLASTTNYNKETFEMCFISSVDKMPLVITLNANESIVIISTDDMMLAGEIVQDLANFLGISELESLIDFPQEMQEFQHVLQDVESYNAARLTISADVADRTSAIKELVIKAEEARILQNMSSVRESYRQLFRLNKEMVAEHEKKALNHKCLVESLKKVNAMIQKASDLRVGKAKSKLITSCRSAIRANNMQSLFKIIKQGATL